MGSRPNLTVKCSANDHSVSVIEIDGQVSWRQKPTSGVNSRDPAISYKLVPWCLHLAALLFNRLWLKQQGKLTPDVEDSRDFFFVCFFFGIFFFFSLLVSILFFHSFSLFLIPFSSILSRPFFFCFFFFFLSSFHAGLECYWSTDLLLILSSVWLLELWTAARIRPDHSLARGKTAGTTSLRWHGSHFLHHGQRDNTLYLELPVTLVLFFFLSFSLSLALSFYWSLFILCNSILPACIVRFRLSYRLILREKELHFNIGVYNPSKDITFSFNLLLHTYFKVPDVRRCQITGLHGCTFVDKVSKSTNQRHNPSTMKKKILSSARDSFQEK